MFTHSKKIIISVLLQLARNPCYATGAALPHFLHISCLSSHVRSINTMSKVILSLIFVVLTNTRIEYRMAHSRRV